jgi:hypothetical protein
MQLLRPLLGALVGLVGCDKDSFDGPGSKADVTHFRNVWGVDLPAPDATLVKKANDLMVYMVPRERLEPYEHSIKRAWQPLGATEVIRHEQFVVDGSTDTKARYVKWSGEDGRTRYIVLDYSTGVVSHFNLAE